MKPLTDRIRDAWRPQIEYYVLMTRFFPKDTHPKAFWYSHNGAVYKLVGQPKTKDTMKPPRI